MSFKPTEKKVFNYFLILLGLIFVLILINKIFFEAGAFSMPVVEKISQPLPKIEINWEALRVPLKITLPEIKVTLEADPATTSPSTTISLTAKIISAVQGQFTYSFDCDGDGIFEFPKGDKVSEKISSKEFKLENICFLKTKGIYYPKVKVEGQISYYNNGQEVTETKNGEDSTMVVADTFNLPIKIVSCDVSAKEGTTQKDSSFIFSVTAENVDKKTQYLWEFGDGSVSSQINPTYMYKKSGFFIPRVTVIDGEGRKDSCVVSSLLGLQALTKFESIAFPKKEDIGREDPFLPY
ncbi:MAG: PKD domain-containing protein [Candidatus Gribaldobacteria bacterium]|nr:PKD domain-containing protein [Candidatus Gribaldobacteria bacterium]